MKKKLLRMGALLLSALCCTWAAARGQQKDIYGQVFRLHVIANSDSAADQAVKLRVRDAIIAYERSRMEGAADGRQARSRLMEDGAGLLRTVEGVLAECGMEYGASLQVGTFAFPERESGSAVYPAGEYAALRVILGEGRGQNWWCVMFPPLCILELPNGEIDYEELRTNSLILKLLKSIDGGKLWNTIKEKLR